MTAPDLAARTAGLIRAIPDWPTAGVTFRDITPLLADARALADVVARLADHARSLGGVDLVAGMEARGFILGAPVAAAVGAGFIPVRKAGKLPGPTLAASYALEYADAEIELHPETVPTGARVLVLDDVLATGGTASATADLVERAGGVVVGLAFLLELTALDGRARLRGREVAALLTVD
ncbi:adenine phosphoribosyltransferase [Cellulomonas sp. ATA003]|uniref:adenine phosphoribosyltransferase n=1 Tax=Cellulomonas sp. ATA003 TaxID=3073064 RepID=UPI002873B19C|nr:adenine phosphoribosyltransferase [Cellulomonas sp. ATA003]WNB87349.1 adenine phosphoribosyltransferase [Cellulomonas sp. ATA003]